MIKIVQTLSVVAAFACAGMQVAYAGPIFSDGTFNDSDWTLTVYSTLADGSVSASQSLIGGNPGSFRDVTQTVPTGFVSAVQGVHIYTAQSYDPAVDGRIHTVAFRIEERCFAVAVSCNPLGQHLGLALRQDGRDFVYSETHGPGGPAVLLSFWPLGGYQADFLTNANLWLVKPDGEFDSLVHPVFGPTGKPIEFGFVTYSDAYQNGYNGFTTEAAYDNWSVEPNYRFVVTEPSSATLLLAGLLGCVGFHRFRNGPRKTPT